VPTKTAPTLRGFGVHSMRSQTLVFMADDKPVVVLKSGPFALTYKKCVSI